ncbi:sulfatase-like hydrolase/transferase [uncultured Pigmentiphaga sp.]|uniref:sulfatase-like hydrolase/transferase n=1 Tax=uncultured Pigmentiphaga sp. TaxID=340361 RepID=UPI00263351C0|nr:sulfatase-like hydrolase/transferase [uncultured Pigmentiphaga sp.]
MRSIQYLAATGVAALMGLAACGGSSDGGGPDDGPGASAPNILFVVMDDVGIDQMAAFGYGGATPPSMPNMTAVADAGLRFRNTWSMPECSPGRAAFFLGRYPTRTGIYQAIGPNDLANSQVSPYEVTVPKLLKRANYESAMFGKFHLAGPENNEAEYATPAVLGWDYFYGWLGGLPGSIDTTAGGVAPEKTYACGFVPGKAAGGADHGACYRPDGSCSIMRRTSALQDAAGLQCLDAGGIFVPDEACGEPPATLDFERENAHYVSPLVIVDQGKVTRVPLSDPRSRGFRTRIETDAAIAWIKSRSGKQPWMASVTYSAAHTPWQQPPRSLIPASGHAGSDAWDCRATLEGRLIQDQMTEAMDTEFGRLLVETGLARRGEDGRLQYDPKASNTIIVIVGDNGTLGSAVKAPFSTDRAKATAYQTGIWVPLIIAGPQVEQPGREVDRMVNAVDLFQFFGEAAGIDAHAAVPRTIDSVSLMPYLTNPEQPSLRSVNFAIGGYNIQANGTRNGACVIGTVCNQTPVSKSVCEDNQGVWWGAGYDDPSVIPNDGAGYQTCWAVNQALFKAERPLIDIMPEISAAIRNDRYKLVRNTTQAYDPASDSGTSVVTDELYEVDQAAPIPQLDKAERNLLVAPTPEIEAVYADLRAKLEQMLAADPDCPGDGNRDGVVDEEDLSNWSRIAREWGLSSVYDFVTGTARDGLTNDADGQVVRNNLGKICPKTYGLY